jgi:hypothetical protein
MPGIPARSSRAKHTGTDEADTPVCPGPVELLVALGRAVLFPEAGLGGFPPYRITFTSRNPLKQAVFESPEYSRQDSNLQPLAPEANALSN